jgi:acetyl-CoA C-acetyltransferase
MRQAVIVGGARTAFGKLLGALGGIDATDLGGIVIAEALRRAGIEGPQVDYVIMGQVIQAGAGQIPSRQAAVAGGIPVTVPSLTINKVCLSGLDAIALADSADPGGRVRRVVAGGMESMTRAPHLLPSGRTGVRYGSAQIVDSMERDGFPTRSSTSRWARPPSGTTSGLAISRAEQDEFAARSHQRGRQGDKGRAAGEEITAVPVPQRRGPDVLFDTDEGVRPDTTADTLAGCGPRSARTARSRPARRRRSPTERPRSWSCPPRLRRPPGATVLAEVGAHGVVAGRTPRCTSQPSRAISAALAKADASWRPRPDRDQRGVRRGGHPVGQGPGPARRRVNVNGGAIALGHPIGASGARLALHLVSSSAGAAAAWACRAVRWRRPGRRAAAAGAGRPCLSRPCLSRPCTVPGRRPRGGGGRPPGTRAR